MLKHIYTSTKAMKKIFIFSILSFFFLLHISATDISSGLNFASHEVIKEKRTSLLLNDGKEFYLPEGFSLDFGLRFRTELHNYGYIFRIIANDTVCFDLVSNYSDGRKSLSFIEGNRIFTPFSRQILEQYEKNSWVTVHFGINPKTKEITISFNGEEIKIPYHYKKLSRYRFQFGYCSHPDFLSYDVPPMAIKNIRIEDQEGKIEAYWPLREHQIAEVYDSVSCRSAIVHNPIWEIDKHTQWEKERSFVSGHYTQIAFNEKDNILYFADQKQILVYHLTDNRIDTILVQSGNPYYVSSNQLIYQPSTNELWSYDFDGPIISRFDFKTHKWSQANKDTKNPIHTHHNSFIYPKDSNLYIFGGYGEYHYKNDFLKLYSDESKWEKIDMKGSIPPRYLSALGIKSENSILIFGGYGHISGLQELGPYNYYDLYEADPYTGKIKKLWSLDKQEEPFVVSNAMIIDTTENLFYTLCFPNNRSNSHIVLKSFDISNGNSRTLADTIPYPFEDINAYCSLFYSKKDNKLYAVTIFHEKDKSQISVYSLLYPPLSTASIIQPAREKADFMWLYIATAIILIIGTALFIIYIRKKKSTVQDSVILNMEEYVPEAIPNRSAILFLGGFQVWDKNGNDITKSFTPTLRYLLILIILYTQKNGKGISNSTMCEILWADKSDESAQNNRRVTIRKLKVLLEEIGGIELVNTNTYWATKCSEPFFCDYYTVFESLKKLQKQSKVQVNKLYDVLHLIANGLPLPYLNQDWVDSFKSDYANYVQDMLWNIVQSGNLTDFRLLTKIADIIFLFDPTDENAIHLKCNVLVKNGKVGLAKSTYDAFCSEYEQLLGTPYNKSFNDICH